jgi:hypothetical protein
MKKYGRVEANLYTFLTSAMDGDGVVSFMRQLLYP